MARVSSFDPAVHSSPAVDNSIRRQATLQDLVPADQSFAKFLQYFFDTLNKITLQLVLVF